LVIIPKDNEKDLAEVPQNVQNALRIVFVDHIDEVLKIAFDEEEEKFAASAAHNLLVNTSSIN
jgi:ATP-dependent Lon protease